MVDAFPSVVFGWLQKVFLLEVASTEIAGGSIVMRAAYRLDVVVLGKMIDFVDGFVCIVLIDTEDLPSHRSSQPYIYIQRPVPKGIEIPSLNIAIMNSGCREKIIDFCTRAGCTTWRNSCKANFCMDQQTQFGLVHTNNGAQTIILLGNRTT
jgi:hypothetical protein